MNRSTWWAVLITVVVLSGAGLAPRLAQTSRADVRAAAAGVERAAGAAQAFAGAALAGLAGSWSGTAPAARLASLGGAGLLLLASVALVRRRRRPRRLALRLLRQGGAPARVARRTGMSQDALRVLLRSEAR